MDLRRAWGITAWLCVALMGATGVAQAEEATLVRHGKAKAYIQLDSHPDELTQVAVQDFVDVVQRVSGSQLTPEPGRGLMPIYVGEPGEFSELNIQIPPLEGESCFLKYTEDAIYLLGGTSLGTQHAIYTLLRDIGCRWIMPGAIGECLPSMSTVALRARERVETPDFRYRDIWYAYGCSPEAGARRAEWLRRNRMNRPAIQHGHNLTSTLGTVAPFEERPDLYAIEEGQRKKTQICTSNPETVALVIKAINQYLDAHPDTIAYSLCPDDNTDFCECDACKALDSGHMDSGGRPSVADRYQVFLNQVFDGLKDTHPNVLLTTYSYNENHTDPPVTTPVHPNTCIFATTSVYCSAHGIGDAFCLSRQAFRDLLARWTALTDHVYIYEYDPVPYSGGLPWPMWEAHGAEMAAYKTLGVKGVSFEGQDSWAAYFLNYYLAAQMMWNASQDPNDLFLETLAAFFLESAPEMTTYYQELASCFHDVTEKVEWGLSDYPRYFTAETMARCADAIARAQLKAMQPLVKQRVEMARLSFEEMSAYLDVRRADDSVTYAEYKANVDRLNQAIDQMAAINEDFLLADIAKEKTSVGLSDRFAREQGFINRWLLCGPFDNTGMEGHDRVYPPEQTIDTSGEYSGKDETKAVWKPNHTPDWQAYVDLLKEFDLGDWVCAYALCYVTVPEGPRDVAFRVGSNDSVKMFLNGSEVWNNKINRPASVDDDIVPVTLPQGISTVLLKIGQTRRDWGFYFRITEPDSLAVPDGLLVSNSAPE